MPRLCFDLIMASTNLRSAKTPTIRHVSSILVRNECNNWFIDQSSVHAKALHGLARYVCTLYVHDVVQYGLNLKQSSHPK